MRSHCVQGRECIPAASTCAIASEPAAPRPRIAALRTALLGGVWLGAVAMLAPDAAHATDGTWQGPGNQWTTGTNWSSSPDVPDGTVTFTNNAAPTSVTISTTTSIGTMQFTAAAPAYSFAVNLALFEINDAGVVNNSAAAPSFTNNGAMTFINASSAGNSVILNNTGGFTLSFTDSATAGNATITTNPFSLTQFASNATGGNALLINDGHLQFFNASTAGAANISGIGVASFNDTSTAGSARITNTTAVFNDSSTAGNATISGGTVLFNNASTAGTATITGAITTFSDASSADNAIIRNLSGLVFQNASTAGNATISTENGLTTRFTNTSSGGTARFLTSAGSAVDISGLTSGGTTAGSIEGAGNYRLGSKSLTVGSNNLSTEVSGSIQDGGDLGGTGGSLVKVGTGTLTLSGANTYSGGTTVAGGTLRLANNQALGTGALTTTGSVVDYANGVSIANAIIINSNTTQLSVTSGSATQAGAISELNGPRPLEKIGAGTLVLSGVNTYSGPTTISGGALVVTGSIANSALTIGSGATLAGTGTVGATTIASGGTFAPGPVGTQGAMTVNGNLAFQSGALYLVQVNPATASSANTLAG